MTSILWDPAHGGYFGVRKFHTYFNAIPTPVLSGSGSKGS